MKLRIALPTMALAIAGALPALAPAAGAVDTTQVTVVDGYQYSADNLLGLTVCFDDTLVQQGDAVINPSIASTPGMHTLSITSAEIGCDEEGDWITTEVTLLDVESQAVAFGWPDYNPDQTRSLETWVFADDLSCTPADQGRISFRNINTGGAEVSFGATDGDAREALFSDVAIGDQASALVASPTYPTAGEASAWAGIYDIPSSVTSYDTAPGTLNVIYAFAGNDGPMGLVNQVIPASVCDVPETEATAVENQPQPTAPVAAAVKTQPTYTG